jgi:hypothetical protein
MLKKQLLQIWERTSFMKMAIASNEGENQILITPAMTSQIHHAKLTD